MEIQDLLAPVSVLAALKVQSKKQLLQELSARAASIVKLPERRIFDALIERERLGTTGIGQGIAIIEQHAFCRSIDATNRGEQGRDLGTAAQEIADRPGDLRRRQRRRCDLVQ